MNFRIVISFVALIFVLPNFGCRKDTVADLEVSKIKDSARLVSEPYLAKADGIVERIITDFVYQKVLLSSSSTPLLTVVYGNGEVERVYCLASDQFRKENGNSLSADRLKSYADLVDFLHTEKLSGFINYGRSDAVVLYLTPNLTLHYLGQGIDEKLEDSYLDRAKAEYDYRGDFCIQLEQHLFLCSERR